MKFQMSILHGEVYFIGISMQLAYICAIMGVLYMGSKFHLFFDGTLCM
jgi:hypothetical protein